LCRASYRRGMRRDMMPSGPKKVTARKSAKGQAKKMI